MKIFLLVKINELYYQQKFHEDMFRRIQAIEEIPCVTESKKMEMNFTVALELHILHCDEVICKKPFYIKFIQL